MEVIAPDFFLIFFGLITAACFALWFFALLDIMKSRFSGSNDKLLWGLIVLFAPFIGVLLYFMVGRRTKIK